MHSGLYNWFNTNAFISCGEKGGGERETNQITPVFFPPSLNDESVNMTRS